MTHWNTRDVLDWREVPYGWEVRNRTGDLVEVSFVAPKGSANTSSTVYVDGVAAANALPIQLGKGDTVTISRKAPHMPGTLQVREWQKGSHPMSRLQVELSTADHGVLAVLK